MTLLQSRKRMGGMAAIWDTVVRPATRSNVNKSNASPGQAALNGLHNQGWRSGAVRFWKREGWRFYPVIARYLLPTTSIPARGFPVMVFCQTPTAAPDKEWETFAVQFCLEGLVVIIVELPDGSLPTKQQARIFLEAVWLTMARKIGGLADSPARLIWWGPDKAAPVVEQAAGLRGNKYYLPPQTVLTRPFNRLEPARDFAGLDRVGI